MPHPDGSRVGAATTRGCRRPTSSVPCPLLRRHRTSRSASRSPSSTWSTRCGRRSPARRGVSASARHLHRLYFERDVREAAEQAGAGNAAVELTVMTPERRAGGAHRAPIMGGRAWAPSPARRARALHRGHERQARRRAPRRSPPTFAAALALPRVLGGTRRRRRARLDPGPGPGPSTSTATPHAPTRVDDASSRPWRTA